MNAKSDDTRRSEAADRMAGGSSAAGRKRVGVRDTKFMIAPANLGLGLETIKERLAAIGGVEIVRTLPRQDAICPPVAIVRMTPEKAAMLRQSTGGALIIELDRPLLAASQASPQPSARAPAVAMGPGFTTTIHVVTEDDKPLAQAEVHLIGRQWAAQGTTSQDGRATLTLFGETVETVAELVVRPRSGHWGLWRSQPRLEAETVNIVGLRPLPDTGDATWTSQAMRLDGLPDECQGRGIKMALIDTGVASSHPALAGIRQGFDAEGRGQAWSRDPEGHGTACAAIIAATSDSSNGIRGCAPEAELHACKLSIDACCSDLVAALDYCVEADIDLACVGFGSPHGSMIVEQRILAAKLRGLSVIAAAGSTGGSVQFPACSPNVLAVGAIGKLRTFPSDSPHATSAADALPAGEFIVPGFSCKGPEVDVCAPGLAVISCQSPTGYAARDGTSLAAAHVAGLGALVLAHHGDFQRQFASRDSRRVERLFQILKETAQPIGDPLQTGAGVPDAARALGWRAETRAQPNLGLAQMRNAMMLAGICELPGQEVFGSEPPRGPAFVTQMPLSPAWQSTMTTSGAETGVDALRAAMRTAGLWAGR
jgi:subtilisin